MPVDVIFGILLLLAIWKGYSRGFIVAIFSFFSLLIGLAAAVKFSAVVANWLGVSTGIGQKWLPILAFTLVMIAVALVVRLIAKTIEATIQLALLGWLNKLLGILLFTSLYMFIYSIVLFYANQIGFISTTTIAKSKTYAFIAPMGPGAIDLLGKLIPLFRDLFEQLSNFFGTTADKIK